MGEPEVGAAAKRIQKVVAPDTAPVAVAIRVVNVEASGALLGPPCLPCPDHHLNPAREAADQKK